MRLLGLLNNCSKAVAMPLFDGPPHLKQQFSIDWCSLELCRWLYRASWYQCLLPWNEKLMLVANGVA